MLCPSDKAFVLWMLSQDISLRSWVGNDICPS